MSVRRRQQERVTSKFASDTAKIRRSAVILKDFPARMPFGQLIYDRRMELGISQAQLSEAIGTEDSMVAKMEKGSRFPDVKYLPSIAKALRFDLVSLFLNFIQQRCPPVYKSVATRIEEPEIIQKLDALPPVLRKTVIDMINALHQEEANKPILTKSA